MGNKESSEGVLPKFPILEEEQSSLTKLSHMNIIPRAITHMPTVTNRAKMSLGERVKG